MNAAFIWDRKLNGKTFCTTEKEDSVKLGHNILSVSTFTLFNIDKKNKKKKILEFSWKQYLFL